MSISRALTTLLAAFALSTPAASAPVIYNQDLITGSAAFDAAVRATGSEVSTQRLWFLTDGARRFDLADFTISASDGGPRLVEDDYAALREKGVIGALSGWAIGLVPNDPAPSSGLSFTFKQPVNAFGLEVGDWATCCYLSSLYIAFDGGATRVVATADKAADNPGWVRYGQYTNFVGAIDTQSTFTRISFYGDGIGEYIVAGGTVRYSSLPLGSVSTVPEAGSLAMLLAGLAAVALHRRRRPSTLTAARPKWLPLKSLASAAVLLLSSGGSAEAAAPLALSLTTDYTFAEYAGQTMVGTGDIDVNSTLFFVDERSAEGLKSWFIFFEPASPQRVQATLSFEPAIVAVYSTSSAIANSTATYGASAIAYGIRPFTGLEGADSISWSPGGTTLSLNWNVIQPGDHIRVLTALPVSAPARALELAGGLLLVGWLMRRRI